MPSGIYDQKGKWKNENVLLKPFVRSTAKSYRKIIVNFLADRDGWKCVCCNIQLNEDIATIDHIIPLSLGGEEKMENLRINCLRCNVSKGHEIRKARGWKGKNQNAVR